ncbi:unnamed protein product [Diatraea saccharalis]|uniref:Hemolin n=1 Tax=Diatraea saccharalis TaxID=40085 RepID=A0A9N9MZQ3_9NEOP|nr:unnamed protein product [Diatraea saccharalis]
MNYFFNRFNDVGNLFITNVSVHQEGRYVCIANNVAGEDRKTIYLNVHEPPKIIEPNDKSFLATNRDMEVVISCNATGKPKPFIAWIREGYYIDNDSNFAVDYDGTLTIKSPSEELSGQYTCVAKNTAGEANKTIPVDIYSIPTHMQSEESHTKIVVVEGTNASVECPLHASRKDIVKWYKDAKMVSTGVLQIMNVTRQNSSEYMCVVHNVAGSALARVLVDVQWPPRLQLHTNNTIQMDVIKGNDWYFDCAADASPRAKTKWLFNKKPMVFEDRDRLKILNVGEKHAGNYQCIVTNIHGTISNTYVLNVLVPPIISEFDLFEVQLKENSDAALECNAKGLPVPDIKWTFNNSEWNIEGSTLISRNVSVDAGGLFRCSASNSAGTTTLTYNVTIVSGARIQEIVLYSQGEGQTVLTRAEVKKDTRVRMSCKASGQPVPKIQWIKTGNVLSENEYNISYADLVLDDVQTVQSGIYSCVVINEGGMDEKKFRLDVLVPPKIFNTLFENGNSTGNTVNLEVLLGQSFSMHCHPYGNPVPEVYWFKDGLPLRLFDDSMLSTDFSEVIVSNKALYEQSGNYTCVARNNVGNTSFVYLVEVLVPPPIPKDTVRTSATRVGHTLNLTCPVEGSPTPVVTWLRQPYVELGEDTPRVSLLNDNVTLFKRLTSFQKQSLFQLINKTEISDSGKYSCVMTNKVGTTEIVFDVTIDMPPSIAGNVGSDIVENHVVPLMRSIVLKCEVKGHPAPWIAWLKDTQRIPNDSSNIQHVFGSSLLGVWRVTSKAAGQYVCVAENNAGAAHRRYNVAVQGPSLEHSRLASALQVYSRYYQKVLEQLPVPCFPSDCPLVGVHKLLPGKWSAWSKWGFCNTTCGLGYQHRHRICQYIDDDNVTYDKTTKSDKVVLDMSECKGSEVDKRRCHMPPCEEPAIARWSPWSPWSSCSATCGSGTQARTRRCKSTRPCYGTNVQLRKCPGLPQCEVGAEKRAVDDSSLQQTTESVILQFVLMCLRNGHRKSYSFSPIQRKRIASFMSRVDRSDNAVIKGLAERLGQTDPYMPEEIYEMEPEVVSMNKNKPPDVEEFDVKTAPRMPSEVFFDVPVTSNLDFSDPGPCRPGFIHNNTFNTCDGMGHNLLGSVCIGGVILSFNAHETLHATSIGRAGASAGTCRWRQYIDECGIEYNQCHVTQVCVNTRGGYRCGCEQGYTSLGAGQRCLAQGLSKVPPKLGVTDANPLFENQSEFWPNRLRACIKNKGGHFE